MKEPLPNETLFRKDVWTNSFGVIRQIASEKLELLIWGLETACDDVQDFLQQKTNVVRSYWTKRPEEATFLTHETGPQKIKLNAPASKPSVTETSISEPPFSFQRHVPKSIPTSEEIHRSLDHIFSDTLISTETRPSVSPSLSELEKAMAENTISATGALTSSQPISSPEPFSANTSGRSREHAERRYETEKLPNGETTSSCEAQEEGSEYFVLRSRFLNNSINQLVEGYFNQSQEIPLADAIQHSLPITTPPSSFGGTASKSSASKITDVKSFSQSAKRFHHTLVERAGLLNSTR